MFDFSDPASAVNLIGLVVPLLVALVTKKVASQGLKSVLNTVLSALLGSAAYLVSASGEGYDFEGFVNAALNTFVVSIVSYYGVYKRTGLAGSIADATANFGVGSPPSFETDDKGEESTEIPVPDYVGQINEIASEMRASLAAIATRLEELDRVKANKRSYKTTV